MSGEIETGNYKIPKWMIFEPKDIGEEDWDDILTTNEEGVIGLIRKEVDGKVILPIQFAHGTSGDDLIHGKEITDVIRSKGGNDLIFGRDGTKDDGTSYVRVTYGEVVILIHGVDLLAESDFLFA